MELLRVRWAIDRDGRANVSAIKSLLLTPYDAHENDRFYLIKDGLCLFQPNYVDTLMGELAKSIVPIVMIRAGSSILEPLGTGFFVSCDGLLVTAGHVITGPPEDGSGKATTDDGLHFQQEDYLLYAVLRGNILFEGDGFRLLPILNAVIVAEERDDPLQVHNFGYRLSSDIAICEVAPPIAGELYQPLPIVQPHFIGSGIREGGELSSIGYAGLQNFSFDVQTRKSNDYVKSLSLSVSKGKLIERFPRNSELNQHPTPGACFSVSAKFPSGMSGSPIFDSEGVYVHGVVSRGWENDFFGSGAMLYEAMHFPLPFRSGRTLLHEMERGGAGMARIFAPDM